MTERRRACRRGEPRLDLAKDFAREVAAVALVDDLEAGGIECPVVFRRAGDEARLPRRRPVDGEAQRGPSASPHGVVNGEPASATSEHAADLGRAAQACRAMFMPTCIM